MGKRSSFERIERDFYPTPYEAVVPLLAHLPEGTVYHEPCAGDGKLIDHLWRHGIRCLYGWDIEPKWPIARQADSRTIEAALDGADCFITNPPWDRPTLHAIIANLATQAPTWLLFDADWPHTKQAVPYLPMLRKIVSVGRIKWIPDSKMTGKDNCCWYLFDAKRPGPVEFVGR